MRKSLLALFGGVTLLAGLVAVPASAGTPAAEPFEPQPGEYKIIQGYTQDPRYVGKPGAVVDALSRGVPVEQLGGGKRYNKHHRLPRTEAEAKRMREQSGQSYTVDAEGLRQGARAADPWNFETCKENYLKAGEPGGWVRDHFSWCEAGTAWATVFPPGGGQEQVETTVYLVGFGKKGARPGTTTDRYVEFQIRADEWKFKGDGPGPHLWERAKDEATFEAKMICTPNPNAAACETGDRNGRKDTIAGWLTSGWAESQLKSAGKPAKKANGDQVQRASVFGWYQFTFPTLTTNPDHSTSGGTGVRFDTAYYMYKVAKRASIFDRVDPFLAFSNQANSGYKKAADHYQKALTRPGETKPPFSDKQIPGGTPDNPLHRLYKGTSEKNRLRYDRNYREAVKACDKWFPGWNGQVDSDGQKKQCDEFPFRSTYEGVARSMAEYNDDLGGPKYQDMYSVLPLSGPQNEAAGRALCSFYNNDRILNMDPYHIKVRAPQALATQGTASTPRAAAGDPGDEPDVPNQDDDACGNP